MWDYLLILLAVTLLAFGFIIQKLYQKNSEKSSLGGVTFSLISAVCSLFFLVIRSGFSLDFTWYSAINALLKGICGLAYTVLGFQIMREGKVAFYMLFLMSGGMIVPCLWGWLFLKESVHVLHVLGVLVIVLSIVLSNLGAERPGGRLLLKCCAVFVLNGFVSVFIKLHQINTAFPSVGTTEYAILGTLISIVMSGGLLLVMRHRSGEEKISLGSFFKPRLILLVVLYSAIGTASSLLQLEGARNLPASVLYPMITGGNIVLTGLFALLIFKEKLSKRGWAGILLCLFGTCLFLF